MNANEPQFSYQLKLKGLFWLLFCASALLAVGTIPNGPGYFDGPIVKAYSALLAIYFSRSAILMRSISNYQKVIAYSATLVALLPFVYAFTGLLNPPFAMPMNKWIGDPIWVFTVPTVSFIAFDLVDRPRNSMRFLMNSFVELILVFPVWTYCWGFLQLVVTDVFIM